MSFKTNISFSIIGLALILFNVSTGYIADYRNHFNQDNIELIEQFNKNDISNVLLINDNVEEEIKNKIINYFPEINLYSFVNFCNKKYFTKNINFLTYFILTDKLIRYSIQPSSFDDYKIL